MRISELLTILCESCILMYDQCLKEIHCLCMASFPMLS